MNQWAPSVQNSCAKALRYDETRCVTIQNNIYHYELCSNNCVVVLQITLFTTFFINMDDSWHSFKQHTCRDEICMKATQKWRRVNVTEDGYSEQENYPTSQHKMRSLSLKASVPLLHCLVWVWSLKTVLCHTVNYVAQQTQTPLIYLTVCRRLKSKDYGECWWYMAIFLQKMVFMSWKY